jgi:hypothetical protein
MEQQLYQQQVLMQLNDLSDVTISSPTTGQILVLQSGGSFQNVSALSGGTY